MVMLLCMAASGHEGEFKIGWVGILGAERLEYVLNSLASVKYKTRPSRYFDSTVRAEYTEFVFVIVSSQSCVSASWQAPSTRKWHVL
jgi:hypothetical protein